jgi:hypothetical protein
MENVDELTSLLKENTVELEQQKQMGDELREELNNRNSRAMELEVDKFFLNGDFHEKCIVPSDNPYQKSHTARSKTGQYFHPIQMLSRP